MAKIRTPTVLALVALCPAIASGQITNIIAASANAFVYRGSATSDQSEAQTLSTKRLDDSNTRIAYVRFELASFLSSFPVANITAARLRLYYTGGASDTVVVYGLDNVNAVGIPDSAWTANMTWNDQPAKTASLRTSQFSWLATLWPGSPFAPTAPPPSAP